MYFSQCALANHIRSVDYRWESMRLPVTLAKNDDTYGPERSLGPTSSPKLGSRAATHPAPSLGYSGGDSPKFPSPIKICLHGLLSSPRRQQNEIDQRSSQGHARLSFIYITIHLDNDLPISRQISLSYGGRMCPLSVTSYGCFHLAFLLPSPFMIPQSALFISTIIHRLAEAFTTIWTWTCAHFFDLTLHGNTWRPKANVFFV